MAATSSYPQRLAHRSAVLPAGKTRREFLRDAVGTGIGLAAGLTASCSAGRYLDILGPPSSLRPSILRMFERETGIQVRPASWVSPSDALAKLFSSIGHSDVIMTLADLFAPAAAEAISRNLLTPIRSSQLPDSAGLSQMFKTDMYSANDAIYSVPVYWGYTSVLYNRQALGRRDDLTDSWGLLFDDRLKGRVALRDGAHESITPAALYLGNRQPLDMDRADLKEVTRFLIAKKKNFRAVWSKFAEAIQMIATGEVDALYGQPVLLRTLARQGMDVAMNVPREGLLLFVQSALIPRAAEHADDAVKWLNFVLRDDVAVKLAEEASVLSPMEAVRRRLGSASQNGFGYEALSAGVPLIRLGRPKNFSLWLEAWAEFKAA